MQVLVQLVLLTGVDADLADRLEATYEVDPEAADEAVALLADDPRVFSRPTFSVLAGKRASLTINDDLELDLAALPAEDDVVVELHVARETDGALMHYDLGLVAPEGRFTAVSRGDVTALVMPVVVTDSEDFEAHMVEGSDPDLRPRARRRAIDELLVD